MPTSRRIVDNDSEDFYPTPSWATKALIDNEDFIGDIWEPACGDGAISKLFETSHVVFSSDLYDRGYGQPGMDFCAEQEKTFDNIITNPPYNLAEDFVHTGLIKSRRKLALLLRLSFLESAKRFNSIYNIIPPTRVWVFSERITFYPGGLQTGGTGTLAYAWFIWDKLNNIGATQLLWFPPRYKDSSSKEFSKKGTAIDLNL